jgi:outer membrane lipoprotein-sorting protein
MNTLLSPVRALSMLALGAAVLLPGARPALADNKATPAFADFVRAFADVTDYQAKVTVHETSDDGKDVADWAYDYRWMRPNLARIEVTDGRNKGGVAVWHGGDKVQGHQGGFLAVVKLNLDIHDKRATSLRGDTIETASFAYDIKHYETTDGTLAEAAGPALDGHATTAVTLAVADPKSTGNVTKDVLDISNATHLPLRRQQFIGTQLVKSETFRDFKANNAFTTGDFS